MRLHVCLLWCVVVTLAAPVMRELHADEIRASFQMLSDPEIVVPGGKYKLDERLISLWRDALKRPEAEMRRLAADAVAAAHREGYPGMAAAIPELLAVVTHADTPPAVRWTAALALITLNARDSADVLFQASRQHGAELRQLIEPALAEWDYAPVRAVWRQRLAAAQSDRRDLLLAVNGTGRARDREALNSLIELVRSPLRPADVRLAAARAAGAIADANLETTAQALAFRESATILDRLCATALLTRHTSDAAKQHLTRLGRDSEPSIAHAALSILFSLDPALVLPLAEDALQSRDANVRLHGIAAYDALPTPPRLEALGRMLDDPHPGNRGRARDALFRWASKTEFSETVRNAATQALASDSWRSQEQAALLIGALAHKAAASRLLTLLESARPEVMTSSAWALRKLAIPETGPQLLDKAERQTRKPSGDLLAVDQQLAHLFEGLTAINHRPAMPLMREYVPKFPIRGELSRSAAVWGLGHMLQGTPDEPLAELMMGRLKELGGMPPEYVLVQVMCAVSIARMKANSQIPAMKQHVGATVDHTPTEYATRWAIHSLTGELLPLAPRYEAFDTGWFLEPVD